MSVETDAARALLEQRPDDPTAHFALAQALDAEGDSASALASRSGAYISSSDPSTRTRRTGPSARTSAASALAISAQSPAPAPAPAKNPEPTLVAPNTPDYGNRPVAYIHQNVAITRAELAEFLIGEAMVVGELFGKDQLRAELRELFLEALGARDAADGGDIFAMERAEGEAFAGVEIVQVERLVRGLDDLGGAVVSADACDEFGVVRAGAFGDEDVAGAAQVRGWFAQGRRSASVASGLAGERARLGRVSAARGRLPCRGARAHTTGMGRRAARPALPNRLPTRLRAASGSSRLEARASR